MDFKPGDKVKLIRECRPNCDDCKKAMGQVLTIRYIKIVEAIGIFAIFERVPNLRDGWFDAVIENIEHIQDNTPLPLPG